MVDTVYVYVVQMMNPNEDHRKDIIDIFANRGDAEFFIKEAMDLDPDGECQQINMLETIPAEALAFAQIEWWKSKDGNMIGFQRFVVKQ